MLLPLDREWTWEAWAAAQKAADPWKKPNTMDEIAKIVHRAKTAGIPAYMMEQALQVPFWVIAQMLQTAPPPDPWRKEMEELIEKFRISEWANTHNLPSPGLHASERERLLQMLSATKSQLWHVTELADPEAVARMRQRMEAKRSDESIVQAYLDLLWQPPDGVLPFQSANADAEIGTKQVRVGFQAISRVLKDLGLTWLNGHAPAVQRASPAMEALVMAELSANPDLAALLDRVPDPEMPLLPAADRTFTEAPPRFKRSGISSTPGARLARRWDRSASDQANTELGRRGEEFVVEIERRRLADEGRPDLAKLVEWTARDQGDGTGYDVASFNADGSPRLIEVKTTNGGIDTSFFVTANEVRVSSAQPGDYWLYRVYNFGEATRVIYTLRGALDGGELTLTPTIYRATR